MPENKRPTTERQVRALLKRRYRLSLKQIEALPSMNTVSQVVQGEMMRMTMDMFELVLTPEDRAWMEGPKTIEELFEGLTPPREVKLDEDGRALFDSQAKLATFALAGLFAVHNQGKGREEKRIRQERIMHAYKKVCTLLVHAVYLKRKPKSQLSKMLVGYFTMPVTMVEQMHNRPIDRVKGYVRPAGRKPRKAKPQPKND